MPDAGKDPLRGRNGDEQVQSKGYVISDEEMKTRLSDELEEMLANAIEHDLDVDKLDGILAALDELDPLPEAEALDVDAGLRRLHERLAEQDIPEDEPIATVSGISSETHRAKTRSISKILLVAAILALIFAVPVQGNLNLFKLLTGRTSEIFHTGATDVQYAQITKRPLAEDETLYYNSVQDMLDDFGITAPLFPTWVPERFGIPEVWASSTLSGSRFYVNYIANDDYIMMQASEIDPSYFRQVESNQLNGSKIKINGIEFHLISDVNAEKAVWQNGALDCQVFGTVSIEELQQMITSIYGGN